jgi:phosphopantetheinyl transferase
VLRSSKSDWAEGSSTSASSGITYDGFPFSIPKTHLKFKEGWRKLIQRSDRVAPGFVKCRIALWLAPVQPLTDASSYQDVLSSDDLVAIDQFRLSAARSCAVASRILLRIGLSHAVDGRVEPKEWRIVSSSSGKPIIGKGQPKMQFSISHTDQIAAVAISPDLPVGVDVESIEHPTTKELIDAFCCGCEQLLLISGPAHQTSREFIRLWTLKEAYSKLIGLGHSIDFNSLGFSLDSLSLLHGTKEDLQPPDVHFETMWISAKTTLHHLSLAIDLSASKSDPVELQVIAPSAFAEGGSAIIAPSVTLGTGDDHDERPGIGAF